MKSEPTLILEALRLIAYAAGLFGVIITVQEQAVISAGIIAAIGAVSVALSIINRLRVFAPDTVLAIATEAATTGVVPVINPPGK